MVIIIFIQINYLGSAIMSENSLSRIKCIYLTFDVRSTFYSVVMRFCCILGHFSGLASEINIQWTSVKRMRFLYYQCELRIKSCLFYVQNPDTNVISAKQAHSMQNWRNCMHPKKQIRIGIWSEPRDWIRKWKSLCLKFATSKSKTANFRYFVSMCTRSNMNIRSDHFEILY